MSKNKFLIRGLGLLKNGYRVVEPSGEVTEWLYRDHGGPFAARHAAIEYLAGKIKETELPVLPSYVRPSTGFYRISMSPEGGGRMRLKVTLFDSDGESRYKSVYVGTRRTWEDNYPKAIVKARKMRDENLRMEAKRQYNRIARSIRLETWV